MPDTFNNIFLTTENLAFSLPLIVVCATYAYFTYIPLRIGIPILVVLFLLEQVRSQIQKLKDKKLTNLDEGTMKNIISELEDEDINDTTTNTKDKDAAAIQKAKYRVQMRLALEKKAAARMKGTASTTTDTTDDVADLTTFAKTSSSSSSTTTNNKSKKK